MPIGGSEVKKPGEVISLMSSDEETVPSRPTRKPLVPRTKVAAVSATSAAVLHSTTRSAAQEAARDVKPIILSDEEDKPTITSAPDTTSQRPRSARATMGALTKLGWSGSKIEADGDVFAMKGMKKELDDMFTTDIRAEASKPAAPTLTDLFADDSPKRTSNPLSLSPTLSVASRASRYTCSGDLSQEDEAAHEAPYRLGSSPSWRLSISRAGNRPQTPPCQNPTPLSRSEIGQRRQEKLKALVQARQTPNRSRRAPCYTSPTFSESSSSASSQDGEEDAVGTAELEEGGEGDYDLARHYDKSLGSLRDFIVDDSDDSGGELETAEIFLDTDSEDDGDDVAEPKTSQGKVNRWQGANDDEVNGGIMVYTPAKRTLKVPDLSSLTIFDSDDEAGPSIRPAKPSKTPKRKPRPSSPPKSRMTDPNWTKNREIIAKRIFRDLDDIVFNGQLSDVKIEWNKRLTSTAGMAKSSTQADGTRAKVVRIELSDKVLSTEAHIRDTLAHEMCHAACFIVNDAMKHGHGKIFKSWGRKVMRARPDIEVTTTHNYTIEYKYQWKCETEACWVVYRRHSKSIDPARERCWACRGRLVPQFATKSATAFQVYLKDNLKPAKAAMPSASHGDVMRALSERWKEAPEGDHRAHWRALAAAQA